MLRERRRNKCQQTDRLIDAAVMGKPLDRLAYIVVRLHASCSMMAVNFHLELFDAATRIGRCPRKETAVLCATTGLILV